MRTLSALALLGLLPSCADEPSWRLTSSFAGGRVNVQAVRANDPKQAFALNGAAVRVKTTERWYSSAEASCETNASPFTCDLGDGLQLQLTVTSEGSGLLLQARVSATRAHEVQGIEVLAGGRLETGSNRLVYLHNGYQSWSTSTTLELPPEFVAQRRTDGAIDYPAPGGSTLDEREGLSSHSIVLETDGGAAVLGFVGASTWQGAFAVERAGEVATVTAINGFTGDTVTVDDAHTVESEPMFIAWSPSAAEAMQAHGEAIASRQSHRPNDAVPSHLGWFSWNRFFVNIDAVTAMRVANGWDDVAGPLPLVEIDDGWERAWGDWRPNDAFPAIAELTAAHAEKQRTVGLWLAPFLVEESLPVVVAHPDWWVRTHAGAPLTHTPIGLAKRLRIVDTTHPEAMAWLTGEMKRLADAGVGFFKIDFLYAAAFDGRRHEPRATGVAALKQGLEALMSATPDAGYNLCGVPWLHAMLSPAASVRVGTDVAFDGPGSGFVNVAWAARNLAARAFGPLVRRSDVDQLVLAPLTRDEAATALAWQALVPGTFALADDPAELSNEKRALVASVVEIVRAQGLPEAFAITVDPFADIDETLAATPLEDLLSDRTRPTIAAPGQFAVGDLAVVTNWSEKEATLEVPFVDPTTLLGPAPEGGVVTLPPHASGLYRRQR